MPPASPVPEAPGLRITFVALNYAPSVGGAQDLIGHVATGLAARGHRVEVVTTDSLRGPSGRDPGRIDVAHEVIDGVVVRRFPVPRWLRRPQLAARWLWWQLPGAPEVLEDRIPTPLLAGPLSPGLLVAARRAVSDGDVVVACSAPYLTLVGPGLLRRRRAARLVALPLLHGSRRPPGWLVRRALRRADATVAMTRVEQEVVTAAGASPASCSVVPPGTDPDGFPDVAPADARKRLGLPERPTVGYVGRLAAYKGIDTLLEAAPLLWERHPDLTVLVAGSALSWDGHRTALADARRDGRLVVVEDFAADDRASLLAACDVVAFPSRAESFGIATIEAWAARRPVVAADIPVVREIIHPGVDGDLVAVGDHVQLAAAIHALLSDPVAARAMGEAGRRTVEADLSWSAIVEQWDAIVRTGGASGERRADVSEAR